MDLIDDDMPGPGGNAHEFTVSDLSGAVKRTLDEGNTLLRQLHTDELVALARHHANRHREIMQWAPRFFADLASSHAKRGQEYADEAQRRARAGGAT